MHFRVIKFSTKALKAAIIKISIIFGREGRKLMAYTFDEFCDDCRETLLEKPNKEGHEKLVVLLERFLKNKNFITEQLSPEAKPGRPIIFQDPETGFCIQNHIHERVGGGPPHDHGSSWAVYGQAVGCTGMTEYLRKDDGQKKGFAELEILREFNMNAGEAGLFDVGEIHSIRVVPGGRVIRITGANLDLLGH